MPASGHAAAQRSGWAPARTAGAGSVADRAARCGRQAHSVGVRQRSRRRGTSIGGARSAATSSAGAEGPEDVLAVLLLARWADVIDKRTGECPLDVAPLLDRSSSLESAGELLRALHTRTGLSPASRGARQSSVRRDRIFGHQQAGRHRGFALGDAGRAASAARGVARHRRSRSTIFHARGGTPARGGGRTENLVEAAPTARFTAFCGSPSRARW